MSDVPARLIEEAREIAPGCWSKSGKCWPGEPMICGKHDRIARALHAAEQRGRNAGISACALNFERLRWGKAADECRALISADNEPGEK